jgi:hypothetical protein
MKLSELGKNSVTSVLVYGPPKSGKTELVGELANYFNLKWLDIENGFETLLKLPPSAQDKIDILSLNDTKDYPIGIETTIKIFKGDPVKVCHIHGKVSCLICAKSPEAQYTSWHLNALNPKTDIVVVDSMTQLTDSAMAFIAKDKPDDYKFDYGDWAHLGKIMSTFLGRVQAAKFNTVVITHETESEMEDGKMKIVPTAGTRNFSRNSPKYFSHVLVAQVTLGKHKFHSTSTSLNNTITGSRTDFDVSKMVNSAGKFSLKGIFS